MSKPKPINPRRGEVWDVILESNAGAEPRKPQPAVIINTDALECLPTRWIVPISNWTDEFSGIIYIVPIKPYKYNGLSMPSAADITKSRWVDVKNFIRRRGTLNANLVEDIAAAMAAVSEYKESRLGGSLKHTSHSSSIP